MSVYCETGSPVSERVTMLTDLLLSLVAGALAVKMFALSGEGSDGWFVAWGLTFGFTSAAALAGGLFHGLRHRLDEALVDRFWQATVILSAGVGLCLMLVAAQTGVGSLARNLLLLLGLAKLLLVLRMAARSWSFAVVAVDSGVSLLVLGGVAAWALYARAIGPEGWWIVAGVALSIVGAAVQQTRVWADRPFDHNDLFHLVQIVASILFFQGAGQG